MYLINPFKFTLQNDHLAETDHNMHLQNVQRYQTYFLRAQTHFKSSSSWMQRVEVDPGPFLLGVVRASLDVMLGGEECSYCCNSKDLEYFDFRLRVQPFYFESDFKAFLHILFLGFVN